MMGIADSAGELGRQLTGRTTLTIDYAPTCVWPSHRARRITVLTHGLPHPQLLSAVQQLAGPERWFRWVQRGPLVDPDQEDSRAAFDELAPWPEWADAVITDADDRSITECVAKGLVPVVGLPSSRFPMDARRALDVVQPWSARGLALQLSLGRPSSGLLDSAAGMRTRRCPGQESGRRSA